MFLSLWQQTSEKYWNQSFTLPLKHFLCLLCVCLVSFFCCISLFDWAFWGVFFFRLAKLSSLLISEEDALSIFICLFCPFWSRGLHQSISALFLPFYFSALSPQVFVFILPLMHLISSVLKRGTRVCVFAQFSYRVSLAATTTTRLRSFWTGAGQCSGSRWPPVGCVSSSTCGPSSPPSSAQSALWPSYNITCGLDVAGWKLTLWAERLPQTSHTLKHNPTLPSVFEMEDYLLPFILYASVYFVLQC